jgi:hypothetical protein
MPALSPYTFMAGTGKTLPYCIGVCPGASELNHEKIPFVLTDVLAVIRIWLLEVQQRQGNK